MSMELRTQLKLKQKLIMTQQLKQSIQLLQLSHTELAETLRKELIENPVLEECTETSGQSEDTDSPKHLQQPQAEEWEDYLGEFASSPKMASSHELPMEDTQDPIETRYAERPTLISHLMWQLRLSSMTERQKELGEIIIGNIDSSGYLRTSIEEMSQMASCTPEEMSDVLTNIQHFDPIGVAARSPQECLLIQIAELGYDRDQILVGIIRTSLEDLEAHRYKAIMRRHHISMEDVSEYLAIIQSLDPMPGASYGGGETFYISPDVFIYKLEKDFVIVINEEDIPQIAISPVYEQIAQNRQKLDGKSQTQLKDYLEEKARSASWLIKSLHQRHKTLYAVVESIVRHQHDFFEHGVTHLKPLVLRDIADDIHVHESTVSRITNNKFAATPYGIFELKFFFNSAFDKANGLQIGSESVKALIKKLIEEEDPHNPLSDDRLSELLQEHLQIEVARRTVAKYRTAMNILPSSRRRNRL